MDANWYYRGLSASTGYFYGANQSGHYSFRQAKMENCALSTYLGTAEALDRDLGSGRQRLQLARGVEMTSTGTGFFEGTSESWSVPHRLLLAIAIVWVLGLVVGLFAGDPTPGRRQPYPGRLVADRPRPQPAAASL